MNLTTAQNAVAGRTAHSYAGSLYLLPSDDEECQRLLIQHRLYTRLLSGRLIFPPITLSDRDEILDIGTGTGAWLCDARSYLPEAVKLYGIDIESRLFPNHTNLPPNVHLSVCSATDLPSHWSSKFALTSQRLLICAHTRSQWRRSIEEMYRVLVSGGYAQLIEIGPELVSGRKTAQLALWMDEFMSNKGMLPRCVAYMAEMLRAAGFVNVKSEEVVMNLGKWAGEDGIQGRDMTIGAWRGMQDSIILGAGGAGRFTSAEDFNEVLDEVGEELDNTEGSHIAIQVFYGRKPL